MEPIVSKLCKKLPKYPDKNAAKSSPDLPNFQAGAAFLTVLASAEIALLSIFLEKAVFSSKRRFRKTWWELVLVGDLVHVSCDEKIPADIVLIRSSDPQGMAFVETSNLDGENNLKQKIVLPGCRNYCRVSRTNMMGPNRGCRTMEFRILCFGFVNSVKRITRKEAEACAG